MRSSEQGFGALCRVGGTICLSALVLMGVCGCATCPLCGAPRTPKAPATPTLEPRREPVTVRGSVTYLQRIAMHPSAVVEVRLWDLSTGGETPQMLAEQLIPRPGQVPVEFELSVADCVDPEHEYGVTARILVDETVLFSTDTDYRVLTKGAPNTVQLVLARATGDGKLP